MRSIRPVTLPHSRKDATLTGTLPPERGFAEVNGARLYYEVAGEGYPFVLIHGGLVHSGFWDDQFGAFARHYRVIRYDARGHGESVAQPGPFYHHHDLRELLVFLGVERAHVVGLSIGGGVALDLALERPETVSGLVLVGAGVEGYPDSEETERGWAEIEAAYEAGNKDLAVELSLRMWTDGPRRTPDEVDHTARERVRAMTARNYFAIPEVEAEELPLDPPALSRLAEVRAPTLVVLGDQDVPDILAIGRLLEGGVVGAGKVTITGTAHHPNLEKPEEFNRTVLGFLSGLDP